MLLYECSDDFPRSNLSFEGTLDSPDMPPAVRACAGPSMIAGWAIGGQVWVTKSVLYSWVIMNSCYLLGGINCLFHAGPRSVGGERGKRKRGRGRIKARIGALISPGFSSRSPLAKLAAGTAYGKAHVTTARGRHSWCWPIQKANDSCVKSLFLCGVQFV